MGNYELEARGKSELAQKSGDVKLHRFYGAAKSQCDLFVCFAQCQSIQHQLLMYRQLHCAAPVLS